MHRYRAIPVVLALALSGCGGGTNVEGEVSFDGEPVDGGAITFVGPGEKKVNGEITAGHFRLHGSNAPAAGQNRVEIVWSKKTGKKVAMPDDPGNFRDEVKQVIPGKYNTASILSEDVGSGSAPLRYDLKSK